MTSGARDDPPIPQSTILDRPLLASSLLNAVSSGNSSRDSLAASTQPSRIADSASASLPQILLSLAKILLAIFSRTNSGTTSLTASADAPHVATSKFIIFLATP